MSTPLLTIYPVPAPIATVRFLSQAWWTCHSSPGHTWRVRSDVVLASGEAYCVVPFSTRQHLDPVIKPVAGTKGIAPRWRGAACSFGRLTIWLPIEEDTSTHRNFSILALLPKHDVADVPPYIFLGTQFLFEYRAELLLGCSTETPTGRLVIPTTSGND
jgi:hypothetical protein